MAGDFSLALGAAGSDNNPERHPRPHAEGMPPDGRRMNDREFDNLCARINSSLDVKEFIDLLGYHADKAIRTAGLWRMFCPIHGDTLFRTLVINPRRNTYHCEYSLCAIHKPADLVDLLARVRGVAREAAVGELLDRFGAQHLRLTATQEVMLREHVAQNLPPPADMD